MRIVKVEFVNIEEIVSVLKAGGLVVFPTETTYGLGADATNELAIKKLCRFKRRPAGKPFSIAVSDINMADRYVHINSSAQNIYKTFLPGPITVVSKGKHKLAKGVESEDGTLGVRIPNYELVTNIIKKLNIPITATSANASYKKRPYNISDILDNISDSQKKLLDLLIDAGELPHNEPSTVVDTTNDDLVVLRQGKAIFGKGNEILTRSEEETKNFAKNLWQQYQTYYKQKAIVFALSGEMGVGKTIFVKGLAKAMGLKEIVTSPTFNLQNLYKSNKKTSLIHIDTWRMSNSSEIYDLDFFKGISDKSVLVIEWAEKITNEIRKCKDDAIIIWLNFTFAKNENDRIINWNVLN